MRNGVDVEHALRVVVAVAVEFHFVVELSGKASGASVCYAIHRGYGHENGIALLRVDEETLVGIGMCAFDAGSVDGCCVAEDAIDDGSVLLDPAVHAIG